MKEFSNKHRSQTRLLWSNNSDGLNQSAVHSLLSLFFEQDDIENLSCKGLEPIFYSHSLKERRSRLVSRNEKLKGMYGVNSILLFYLYMLFGLDNNFYGIVIMPK